MKTSLKLISSLILFTSLSAATVHAVEPSPGLSSATSPIEKESRAEKQLLQRHKPFYFAYGRPNSKLQVSFKTPLLNKIPLFFGYTQFMFWALSEKSKPFRDLTYNPEVFYRLYAGDEYGVIKSLDLGIFGHNSNGKAGDVSRSYDTKYLRLNLEKEGHRWTTRANIQVSYLHGFDDTNRDIQTYIGPLSINLTFAQLFDAWFDKSEVSLQLTPGGKFSEGIDRGGYQLSWSFRLGAMNLTPAFYLQYYHGYAETLLNYANNVDEFRGGVIF